MEEKVKELLSDRHVIIGKMFRLHVTEQEVVRFREVNGHLQELTRKMFCEHKKLLDSLKGNPVLSVICWDDVVVESRLDVDEDAEVLHYDDDNDYGSNFSQMIDAIAWTEDWRFVLHARLLERNQNLTFLITVPHGPKVVWMYPSSTV